MFLGIRLISLEASITYLHSFTFSLLMKKCVRRNNVPKTIQKLFVVCQKFQPFSYGIHPVSFIYCGLYSSKQLYLIKGKFLALTFFFYYCTISVLIIDSTENFPVNSEIRCSISIIFTNYQTMTVYVLFSVWRKTFFEIH